MENPSAEILSLEFPDSQFLILDSARVVVEI